MNILYLITARGGSKSVPKKNLRKIAGLSLVGFKARSALKSKYCTDLIISTDSQYIQQEAMLHGVSVPFTRPKHLATDTASSMDVVVHAMDWIENNTASKYDAVMLLEPSSPFAKSIDYDAAVEMMLRNSANVVVGVRETEINSMFAGELDLDGRITNIIDNISNHELLRRQDFGQEYTMNGGFYLFKWDFFKRTQNIYRDRDNSFGYIMDRYHSIEIDELIDLEWAEFLVEYGYVDMSYWS